MTKDHDCGCNKHNKHKKNNDMTINSINIRPISNGFILNVYYNAENDSSFETSKEIYLGEATELADLVEEYFS